MEIISFMIICYICGNIFSVLLKHNIDKETRRLQESIENKKFVIIDYGAGEPFKCEFENVAKKALLHIEEQIKQAERHEKIGISTQIDKTAKTRYENLKQQMEKNGWSTC